MTLANGTLITNGHDLFEITGRDEHADSEGLEYSGYFAVVTRGLGEGQTVYLDDRNFSDGALAVMP